MDTKVADLEDLRENFQQVSDFNLKLCYVLYF